jgi:CHAT domain-containing protein/Tfp pilus assembly protein PilF
MRFYSQLRRRDRLAAVCLFFGVAAFLLSSHAPAAEQNSPPEAAAPREISHESSDVGEIAGGEHREYAINLRSGQLLSLKVIKADLNLSVKLTDPEGRPVIEFLGDRFGPLQVYAVAESSGAHRLEISSLEEASFVGRYELRVEEARDATRRDRAAAAATRSLAAAVKLRAAWQEAQLREAVGEYLTAYELWKSVARLPEAAEALEGAGEIHFVLGEYPKALGYFNRALRIRRRSRDSQGEAQALDSIGYVYVYMGETDTAFRYFQQALSYYRQPAPQGAQLFRQRGEAQVNNNMGEVYYYRGDLKTALRHFDKALEIWGDVRDRTGQAIAHLNIGYTHADSGDLPKALESFRQALRLWRKVGDRRGEALSETAIGTVFSFLGEKQVALDSHTRAMQFFRAIGDHTGEAVALNSIGRAYEDLNEPLTALDNYELALKLYKGMGNRDAVAVTEYYIGRLHHSRGATEQALSFYNRSMALSRRLGKRRLEAYALLGLGALYGSAGEKERALNQFGRVLKFYRDIGDRRGQAFTLNNIGYTYYLSGDKRKALSSFREALPLCRAASDRGEEASILYHVARAERDLNNLDEALARMEESAQISESLRTKVTNPTLRTSYFSSVNERYRFYIDLLMHAHAQRPDRGFSAAALRLSERAHARSLLELLAEGRVDIREGADPALLERERTLQQILTSKTEYAMRLRSQDTDAEATGVEDEVRRLTTEYEEVQSRIREQSPHYAALTQPRILGVEDIQAELRGEDTLLLEYARGNEKVYMWLISSSSAQSFEVGDSLQIEEAARKVYELLTARQPVEGESFHDYHRRVADADRQYLQSASDLSEKLLGRVADQLGNKRLLIITDGALKYIPFEALPSPARRVAPETARAPDEGDDGFTPLVLEHEVVNLPSATMLATLRGEAAARRTNGQKTVAVIADPVFDKSDPRVQALGGAQTVDEAPEGVAPNYLAGTRGSAGDGVSRLPFSMREAETIMDVTPPGEGLMETGFDASRATAMESGLDQYRIIHFATHSVINNQHPELSGILLSMFDRQGRRENGFLQLHDIYNLRLSSDLVVLSACSTGLGKDIEGEGFMGLTRGFMYAGSSSIVASLWKVDDSATAELMGHFYKAMLRDGLPPAAALRAAKEAMWRQERWKHPYYWAAFVLQGDFRERADDGDARRRRVLSIVVALVLIVGLSAAFTLALRRRRGGLVGRRQAT